MLKGLSLLDFKLGLRMLVKYPWLTVVGGLGMAVAVAIGASFFGIIYSMMDPTVPLPNGERIVSIQNWSDSTHSPQRNILHDFHFWRSRITTMDEVGAWHPAGRNIITPYGDPEPLPVAEMTASGFRTAGVVPLLGRYLRDSDESADAAPVAVIGEKIWRERYADDPRILGQTIQAGAATYRIVGVMPERFAFPMNHQVWVPLKLQPAEYEPRTGPVLHAFGRLKRGTTLEDAQAELSQIGKQMSAANPATHAKLRPTVLPYTYPFVDIDDLRFAWLFHGLQVSVTLLLVLVCANVATLIYARTATRQGEIAVRTALGASRVRIVGQLFVEALVLAIVASIAGITIAKGALTQINLFFTESYGDEIPFWMRPEVSSGVVAYTVLVTVLAAAIVGALPALKATGRRVQSQLRQMGGGSGLLLGRTWTVLIVAQVAFAVAILPSTLHYAWRFATYGSNGVGFRAEDYMFGILQRETREGDDPRYNDEKEGVPYAVLQRRLLERLRAEPAVAGATVAWRLPGHEPSGMIEVEGIAPPKDSVHLSSAIGSKHGHPVKMNRVDSAFFSTFGVRVVEGRTLSAIDYDSGTTNVLVNEAFVSRILQGQSAIGRRFRYVGNDIEADSVNTPLHRWFTITGVVTNFPAADMRSPDPRPRVYHSPARGRNYVMMVMRLRGQSEPAGFSGRVKRIATTVDPTLQLVNVRNLKDELTEELRIMRLSAIALITLTASVLLMSAAGIYSLMSLTVNQRRREIGIRSALGAYPRYIMAAVFMRATRQLAIGVAIGVSAALIMDVVADGFLLQGNAAALIPGVAVLMASVGLLAAWGPARRGLRIQPTEALRDI